MPSCSDSNANLPQRNIFELVTKGKTARSDLDLSGKLKKCEHCSAVMCYLEVMYHGCSVDGKSL